jgi:hypothetical protein
LRHDVVGRAAHGAGGGGDSGAGYLGGEAALLGDRDAGAFLGEGLSDQRGGEADLGAGGDELLIGDEVRGLVAWGLVLELGGAGEDALDGGAVEGAWRLGWGWGW